MKGFILVVYMCSMQIATQVYGIDIPVEWKTYLSKLSDNKINKDNITTAVIEPPTFRLLLSSTEIPTINVEQLILPHILCWHPLIQFPSLSQSLNQCPVDSCSEILNFHSWVDGSNKGLLPRLLHDMHHIVLLVGAIYKCCKGHHVHSTDPRILKKIDQVYLPFHLLHRTGFTRAFVSEVVHLAHEGLPICAIARHVTNLREEYGAEQMIKLMRDYSTYAGKDTSETNFLGNPKLVSSILQPYPTNDIIARCLLIDFQKNERMYCADMASKKVGKCIRLDHTFKVASNIGYLRSDKKWITQYGSIFIVLNELGQVVTWQLTNSTSFDEVELLLSTLNERIEQEQDDTTLIAYVDNCCHIKNKIQKLLGNNTIVKLDLFHAVQRVTRHISKKHLLYHACISDFKMIFREKADIGKKRSMMTPNTSQLTTNLNNFVAKWKTAEYNGIKILTQKVLEQIELLFLHVKRGCLSNIDTGGGTNYNEALHRYINPHFNHAGRMGIPLAYALLTILFYRYNCKRSSTNNTFLNIIAAKTAQISNSVKFGIISKDHIPDIHDQSSDNEENILYTSDASDMPFFLPVHDIETILKNAIHSTDVAKQINKMSGKSPLFSYHMMPFMSSVPSIVFHCLNNDTSSNKLLHDKRLSDVLDGWDLCKHEIIGDGNCCFTAVAFSLMLHAESLSDEYKHFLLLKEVNLSMGIEEVAMRLRQLAVNEWLENSAFYQEFMKDIDIESEAPKFLSSGFYHSDLADTMVLSLANTLETTIIVFSSVECHPLFCVTPRKQVTSMPIMIAFTQFGSGHYDGVLPRKRRTEEPTETEQHNDYICHCGKNDKTTASHCKEINYKYTTLIRCECLKKNHACKESCKCKNCNNPLGKKPEVNKRKRKREKHDWQAYQHKSSTEFANEKKEDLAFGSITVAEYFVMENILLYLNDDQLQIEPTSQNLLIAYNQILPYANHLYPMVPIRQQTVEQFEKFLVLHDKKLQVFASLCDNQLNWNALKEDM